MSFAKRGGINSVNGGRPATSLELDSIDERKSLDNSDGMRTTPYLTAAIRVFSPRKQRHHHDQMNIIYTSGEDDAAARPAPSLRKKPSNAFRNISITTGMQHLSLQSDPFVSGEVKQPVSGDEKCPNISSYIPKPVPFTSAIPQLSPTKPERRFLSPSKANTATPFLSKYSNVQAAWQSKATSEEHFEKFLSEMSKMNESHAEYKSSLQGQVDLYKAKSTYSLIGHVQRTFSHRGPAPIGRKSTCCLTLYSRRT